MPIIRSMKLPNQADSVFNPKDTRDLRIPVLDAPTKSVSDLDYLSVSTAGVTISDLIACDLLTQPAGPDIGGRTPASASHVCSVTQELLAIQQSDGPKNLGFFGTRNMGVTHQKLVEILAYAYASTVRGRAPAMVARGRG